jgi:hypothetical protein
MRLVIHYLKFGDVPIPYPGHHFNRSESEANRVAKTSLERTYHTSIQQHHRIHRSSRWCCQAPPRRCTLVLPPIARGASWTFPFAILSTPAACFTGLWQWLPLVVWGELLRASRIDFCRCFEFLARGGDDFRFDVPIASVCCYFLQWYCGWGEFSPSTEVLDSSSWSEILTRRCFHHWGNPASPMSPLPHLAKAEWCLVPASIG